MANPARPWVRTMKTRGVEEAAGAGKLSKEPGYSIAGQERRMGKKSSSRTLSSDLMEDATKGDRSKRRRTVINAHCEQFL